MAFAYLNLPGRIWQANGLNYLLGSSDANPCFNKPGVCGKPVASSNMDRSRSDSKNTPVSKTVSDVEKAKDARAPFKAASWQPVSPENWPLPWQHQLAHSKKGRFAWTYMELGADLLAARASGEAAEAASQDAVQRKMRSQCLRKIFADLAHPVGTHTFWPISLPQPSGTGFKANPDCFWSGLDSLGCRGVVIMGSPAACAAMGTSDLKPLSQLFKFGKLVWILWDAQAIIANPVVYNKVLVFLKRSLANFIRL